MANAKTYNDLNQATEVNDTDKLALAQSDKQELVTATVGQVAQKVANIVSTDQVTEIVTDLGMGKQIMAQKLQDKGLDVTASDTLTAMANKVDTLDVVGAKEYIRVFPCWATQGRPSPSNGYCITLPYKNVILCVDVSGKTVSTKKMVAGSETWQTVSQVEDTEIEGSFGHFTYSKDNSYVVFMTKTGSNPYTYHAHIYSIDDQGLLTKVRSAFDAGTLNGTSTYTYTAITNDGKYLYRGGVTANNDIRYTISTGEATPITYTGTHATNVYFSYMIDDNTIIFYSSEQTRLRVGTGSIVGDTIEHSGYAYVSASAANSSYGFLPATKDDLFFIFYTYSTSIQNGICCVYDAKTRTEISRLTFMYLVYHTGSDLSWYASRATCGFRYDSGKKEYKLYSTIYGIVYYDVTNKILKCGIDNPATTYGTIMQSSTIFPGGNFNTYGGNSLLSYVTEDGGLYITNTQDSFSNSGKFSANGSALAKYVETPICTGLIYKRNAKETPYVISKWSDADYEAGAYDIDNTKAEVKI